MIGLMVRTGGLVLWAASAQAQVSCEDYAEAMVTAVGRDAGISRVEAITAAIEADDERTGFAENTAIVIEAVYASEVMPHLTYTATLEECKKAGGW
jgi:hypothetical protein